MYTGFLFFKSRKLSSQETWGWGWGRHFWKKGTMVRRGYCIYIHVCVCVSHNHSHILHAYFIFLHNLLIMIHNYKFDDYLNNEHSYLKFEKENLINDRLNRCQLYQEVITENRTE